MTKTAEGDAVGALPSRLRRFGSVRTLISVSYVALTAVVGFAALHSLPDTFLWWVAAALSIWGWPFAAGVLYGPSILLIVLNVNTLPPDLAQALAGIEIVLAGLAFPVAATGNVLLLKLIRQAKTGSSKG